MPEAFNLGEGYCLAWGIESSFCNPTAFLKIERVNLERVGGGSEVSLALRLRYNEDYGHY